MSDLQNLTDPIEENIPKAEKKPVKDKIETEKLKIIINDFKINYGRKLLVSLGLSVFIVACVIIFLNFMKPQDEVSPPVADNSIQPEIDENEPTINETDKYTRFDGNQYYFYIPREYSQIEREPDPMQYIQKASFWGEGHTRFILTEYNLSKYTDRNSDGLLQKTEIVIGGNKFSKSKYDACAGLPEINRATCESIDAYKYTTEVNGILVEFELPTDLEEYIELNVLNTFTKNIIDPNNLGETYVLSNLPRIKTKIDAHIALGTPKEINIDTNCVQNCSGNIIHQLKDSMEVILEFDEKEKITDELGQYGQFRFDLDDALANPDASINPQKAHEIIANNRNISSSVLDKNPEYLIFLQQDPKSANNWLITITNEEPDGIKLGEYLISKDKGALIDLASPENQN